MDEALKNRSASEMQAVVRSVMPWLAAVKSNKAAKDADTAQVGGSVLAARCLGGV